MTTHVYRAHAVEQARQQGLVGFRTLRDRESMWKARYEPGENEADQYAEGNLDWVSHGEVGWVAGRTGDEGPTRVGVLVVQTHVKVDDLETWGTVTRDPVLARVWLYPSDRPGQPPFLVEPMDSERWSVFAPKVGEETATAGVQQPRRSATSATSPILNRSTADSPVKRVHAIADSMPGASRKDVVAACVAAGINPNTASTQYGHWRRAASGST